MPALDFELVDLDSHMYEPRDSFLRHIPEEFQDRAVHAVVREDGSDLVMAGHTPVHLFDNEIFDKVGKPGSLRQLLRDLKKGDGHSADYLWEPTRPEYTDREARLASMDEQGVQACLVFGSIAVVVEHFLAPDPAALYANYHSFNEWLDETWGFNHQDRIFAPPWISLRDPDRAVAELEWALDRGARAICLKTGHAYGRSPADPIFDPFWARANEAGVVLGYHIVHSNYNEEISGNWGEDPSPPFFHQSAWQWANCYGDRPIMDTVSALIFGNLFGRFPDLQLLSVEHGSEWVPYLMRRMDKMRGMGRNGPWIGGPLTEKPSEIFKRHVKVIPYPEDDVEWLLAQVGPEPVVFGSDWPHPEGFARPSDFANLMPNQPPDVVKTVMRDNGARLLRL